MIVVLRRYLPRIDRLGNDSRAVLIRHHYVFALIFNTRYREAATIQQETSAIAERVGDSRSKAYSLASFCRETPGLNDGDPSYLDGLGAKCQ